MGKINVTRASQEQCRRLQKSRWCRYWFFDAYIAGLIHNAFQWAGHRRKLPLSIWVYEPPSITHGLFGTSESILQSASRSVQPFLQGSRT